MLRRNFASYELWYKTKMQAHLKKCEDMLKGIKCSGRLGRAEW